MYIQKIATILMDDEIHDLILGDDSEQRELQEYIFIDNSDDMENLLDKISIIVSKDKENDIDYLYLRETIREIKEALILLEKDEIQSIVFVYQN